MSGCAYANQTGRCNRRSYESCDTSLQRKHKRITKQAREKRKQPTEQETGSWQLPNTEHYLNVDPYENCRRKDGGSIIKISKMPSEEPLPNHGEVGEKRSRSWATPMDGEEGLRGEELLVVSAAKMSLTVAQ